jgi:hypothetical protein
MIQGKENLYIFASSGKLGTPTTGLASDQWMPEATGRKRNVIA